MTAAESSDNRRFSSVRRSASAAPRLATRTAHVRASSGRACSQAARAIARCIAWRSGTRSSRVMRGVINVLAMGPTTG